MKNPRPKDLDDRFGWCTKPNHGIYFHKGEGCHKCSTETQRIKVAELCGLEDIHGRAYGNPYKYRAGEEGSHLHYTYLTAMGSERFVDVPHYLSDLNAMHEAEALHLWTNPDKWLKYVALLRDRTDHAFGGAGAEVGSTAAQRAESFVIIMDNK